MGQYAIRNNYHSVKMKRIVNILFAAVALLGFVACEDEIGQGTENPPIYIPENGYIFFDSEVKTRGTLIENTLPYDFGVVGYKYSGTNWTGYKAKAKPNVFVDNGTPMDNETVVWDGTSHNYEPLVEWTEDTYAFFAYYPATMPVSGKDYEGTPYLTYNVDRNDPTKLVDVMTSSVIGTSAAVKSVSFHMKHRLSAVSLYARSYVRKSVFEELKNTDTEVYVKITDVDVKFNGISYDSAKIPLDDSEKIIRTLAGVASLEYNDFTNDTVLEYFDDESKEKDITSGDKTMVLIPQEEPLTCSVTVSYDIVNASGVSMWASVYPDMNEEDKAKMQTQTQTVELDMLDDQTRHYIILSFTKTGLSVDATKTLAWDDQPVEYEFE